MMILLIDKIKSVWEYVDRIPKWMKNMLIVIFIAVSPLVFNDAISTYYRKDKVNAETYAMNNSMLIQSYMDEILNSNAEICSVLLLNYHNSTESLHGYQYLYISSLTCSPVNDALLDDWDKVKFTPYSRELQYVHMQKVRTIARAKSIDGNIVSITKKLASQGLDNNILYTINGLRSPIGILVVTFRDDVDIDSEYLIMQKIGKLAIILDYENIR